MTAFRFILSLFMRNTQAHPSIFQAVKGLRQVHLNRSPCHLNFETYFEEFSY